MSELEIRPEWSERGRRLPGSEVRAIEYLDKGTLRLVRRARSARRRAYAPYSKYAVGCVIVDAQGKTHTGCNVENASYPLAICAERAAIVKMVSRGSRDLRKIVLMTSSEEPVFPCGMCLQAIQEFGRNAVIVAVNKRASLYRQATMKELFPFSFTKEKLPVERRQNGRA